MPKHLRQDIYNIYAFSRIADDFADQSPRPIFALKRIDGWEKCLDDALEDRLELSSFDSDEQHFMPLFLGLVDTIRKHNLTVQHFRDLLNAFRMDQEKNRYENHWELRKYTQLSAQPIGRLVLEVFGEKNPALIPYSDDICTALQLTNHWQDVKEDYLKDRLYIPLDEMDKFNVSEDDIDNSRCTENFAELMKYQVSRTTVLFIRGKSIIYNVKYPLNMQLSLYWNAGLKALDVIKRNNYNVFDCETKLDKWDKMNVAINSLFSLWF